MQLARDIDIFIAFSSIILEHFVHALVLIFVRMQHKGEIIEKAVRESGFSITRLAERMGKSRRWVYQIFESQVVPVDYILAIGKIIHHDFTEEVEELKTYKLNIANQITNDPQKAFGNDKDEVEYWKNKYLSVLEKYNELLISTK